MKKRIVLLGIFCLVTFFAWAQPKAEEPEYDLAYFLPDRIYSYNPDIPTPKTVLGFELGRQHVDWGQVVAYMQALAASSERVSVCETGRTYQHRPFLEVAITSPENQRKLESIRQEHLMLAEPSRSSSVSLENMPVVVSLVYSIHGNEPSGVNASLAVAYFLAAAQGDDMEELLDKTVILLTPGANPDGINRFASWVNSSRSLTDVSDVNSREFQEPWPSSRSNHYWADCNRDWLMVQHPEGRNGVDRYLHWLPNVVVDQHEQGAPRPFYFSPGHPKRTHPLTPAENQRLTAEISAYTAQALDRIGTLYYSKEGYDDFYYGKGAAYGDIHGSVCLLFEQGATRGHLKETRNGIWPFHWAVRNQATASLATVFAAFEKRESLLDYQRRFFRQAAEDAAAQTVKGYVFDTRGSRSVLYHFLDHLAHHQIEVYQLAKDFQEGGETFRAGEAWVIPVAQKYNTMLRTLMENTVEYEDSIFYDISSWASPYAFNLRCRPVQTISGLLGGPVRENRFVPGQVIGGKSEYAYVFENTEFYTPKVVSRLLQKGLYVYASNRPFRFRSGEIDRQMGYGTFLVAAQNQVLSSEELYQELVDLARETGVDIYAAGTGLMEEVDLGSAAFQTLRMPRVAILTGRTMGVADSGEAWFLLDYRFQMRPVLIEATTALTLQKLSRYQVVILANGVPSLSRESEAALKEWVAGGGTLIASGKAYTWLNRSGLLPLRLKKSPFQADSTAYLPFAGKKESKAGKTIDGVILRCQADPSHPLLWGLNQTEIAVMKNNELVFEKDPDPYVSPLYYAGTPLLSGCLSGQSAAWLENTPAVFARKYKNGSVVFFADDMNFRSYYFGTSQIFMNAVLFGNCF